MSVSSNLRNYFKHPSAELERLLLDVEDQERLSDRQRGLLVALYGDKPIQQIEQMVTEQLKSELAAEG